MNEGVDTDDEAREVDAESRWSFTRTVLVALPAGPDFPPRPRKAEGGDPASPCPAGKAKSNSNSAVDEPSGTSDENPARDNDPGYSPLPALVEA